MKQFIFIQRDLNRINTLYARYASKLALKQGTLPTTLSFNDYVLENSIVKLQCVGDTTPVIFTFNDHQISIRAIIPPPVGQDPHYTLEYSIFAATHIDALDIFKKFIKAALEDEDKFEQAIQIKMYDIRHAQWNTYTTSNCRPLDSVYINKAHRDSIIHDVDDFINSKSDYMKFAIPYRRNYLLYGPPGSGKTSLIKAIASHTKRHLFILNFVPDMTDSAFIGAISYIADNSILLLEDLDTVFVEKNLPEKCSMTISGLLNGLDGIGDNNSLMVFITANNINRLDPALLRAGRIDFRMQFIYADEEQIHEMFIRFLPTQENNWPSFWKIIKSYKNSMASLQKILFEHRHDSNILSFKDEIISIIKLNEPHDSSLYT